MINQVLSNQVVMGGGKTNEPINRNTVLVRFASYSRRYWHREPSRLTQEQRITATLVLQDIFGFQQKDIAPLFHISRVTAYKDHQTAQLYFSKVTSFQQNCKKLEDYIRYYSKFIPVG